MTEPNYSLESESTDKVLALPDYDYHPQLPKSYRPKIGLVGCGGITVQHLTAYMDAGLGVVALCDLNREAAEARRAGFFPETEVFTDPAALLARADNLRSFELVFAAMAAAGAGEAVKGGTASRI